VCVHFVCVCASILCVPGIRRTVEGTIYIKNEQVIGFIYGAEHGSAGRVPCGGTGLLRFKFLTCH
jgi:hypothetical protein